MSGASCSCAAGCLGLATKAAFGYYYIVKLSHTLF